MRRPIGFLLLTIVAASIASLVVYSSLKQKQLEIEKARAGNVSIVVAAHDLAFGVKLDANAVKLVPWPHDMVPAGAAFDTHAVLGMITKAEFLENQPIVSSRLVSPEMTSGVLPLMIPKDLRAMSVAVDEVADMAGFILPFTRVDVLLALPASGNQSGGRSKIILENVQVLAVAQTVERKDQPQPERIVTLLVTPEEAERLALAEGEGKLHLALRNYTDDSLIATTGANVDKVMAAFSPEGPPPTPSQPLASRPYRITVRPHPPRRHAPSVQVLRDGQLSQLITLDAAGHPLLVRQMTSAQSTQAEPPPAPPTDNDIGPNDNSVNGAEQAGFSTTGLESGNSSGNGGIAY